MARARRDRCRASPSDNYRPPRFPGVFADRCFLAFVTDSRTRKASWPSVSLSLFSLPLSMYLSLSLSLRSPPKISNRLVRETFDEARSPSSGAPSLAHSLNLSFSVRSGLFRWDLDFSVDDDNTGGDAWLYAWRSAGEGDTLALPSYTLATTRPRINKAD